MAAGVFEDLTGKQFGKLLVVKKVRKHNRNIYWECVCECGNVVITPTTALKKPRVYVKSCGCCKEIDTSSIGNDKNAIKLPDYIGRSLAEFGNTVIATKYVKAMKEDGVIEAVKKQFDFDVTMKFTADKNWIISIKKKRK